MDKSVDSSHNALDPNLNITVSASAGSGKTYLLINRIVSLLMSNAKPASILAITFTRKAANEILERVYSRLWELHNLSEDELASQLQKDFKLKASPETLSKARQLYSEVLFAEPKLKVSTFHAFCQDILQHFALDSDLPPAFELTEKTYLLADEAWDRFFKELSSNKNHPLRPDIDLIYKELGQSSTRQALINGFLDSRSDWWSFIDGTENSLGFAIDKAKRFFKPTDNPELEFVESNKDVLIQFSTRIQNLEQNLFVNIANAVSLAYDQTKAHPKPFQLLRSALLTASETKRAGVKATKTLEKAVGADNMELLINEYHNICDALIRTLDQVKCNKAYAINRSWYRVGEKLLEHYQNIKRSRRLLDFSDLEWQTYKMLNKSDNAEWIQYKLDNRIDHLLVDEFQDTNSTQWQMILPLLEEMASSKLERKRSVFLVGDTKQSIYSFRRANPELQHTASKWLEDKLQAHSFPLDKSWRSADAIMQVCNNTFLNRSLIGNYNEHATYKSKLIGHVEKLGLFQNSEEEKKEATQFRNPLLEALPDKTNDSRSQEAIAIAEKIQTLISQGVAVTEDERAAKYEDIYILIKQRTNSAAYEEALSKANIPFEGAEVGTLLDCQEVDDIICLLTFLTAPFNNLALAQLIKSPIFNGTDQDLIKLAEVKTGNWFEKLATLHQQSQEAWLKTDLKAGLDKDSILVYAYEKLQSWMTKQEGLAVHDLLNLIYHDGNIIQRFTLSSQPEYKSRVKANLEYLLELALNIDSGRYPSIMRFLQHIQKIKSATNNEKPNSLREKENSNRVKIMTIHAAKGLEAPIVFLADTYTKEKDKNANSCFVNWPPSETKAQQFFLLSKKADLPECLVKLLNEKNIKSEEENNNLLYVAMTRAVNYLFISGSKTSEIQNTWYERVQVDDSTLASAKIVMFTTNQALVLKKPCYVAIPFTI